MIRFSQLGRAGQLGNQLWQIASTIGVGRMRGETVQFPATWRYRHMFNIPDEYFGPCDHGHETPECAEVLERLPKAAAVYLQHYELWQHMEGEIREMLTWSWQAQSALRDHAMYSDITVLNPVSVHVRGGDYSTNPPGTMNSIPVEYYHNAMGVWPEGTQFVIFTDDPEYCRGLFQGHAAILDLPYPIISHEGSDDWMDMALMSRCTRHVIANSTYSWWGAYLAHDESALFPNRWFGERMDQQEHHVMIPPGWREIPCS